MKFYLALFTIVLFASAAQADPQCAPDSTGRMVCAPGNVDETIKQMGHEGTVGGAGCTQDPDGHLTCSDPPVPGGADDMLPPPPPVSPVPSPDETGIAPSSSPEN